MIGRMVRLTSSWHAANGEVFVDPEKPQYWRQAVERLLIEASQDEILCLEDFIESALVQAYKLGAQHEEEANAESVKWDIYNATELA